MHADRKKQRVVLGTEVVALLEWDRSSSLELESFFHLVGSFVVPLSDTLRAGKLKLQQERLRLDGRKKT